METLVDRIPASPDARERTKVMLLTLSGPWSVRDGYECLGIGRTRFQDLRRRMIESAVQALERGPAGRPQRRPKGVCRERRELRRRVVALEHELRRTQTALDIARSGAGTAVAARLAAKGEWR
jgi:hypothetical protein